MCVFLCVHVGLRMWKRMRNEPRKKRDDANTDETRNCDEQRGVKENGDE